ncbi:DUF4382 domain-containing protein [Permianibacter sp. IMCC34836]|uniref:DUF4382 domain-containing protein n=1 Tax=Permianibacter fluminis TaxID=2738515 RepID=UPI00155653E1|nr:DUF4382 domain-containing protein [Permianibacter fluminis]NQD35942.1 DUF4382 domain-containing protein [Permianibacter fluminis]
MKQLSQRHGVFPSVTVSLATIALATMLASCGGDGGGSDGFGMLSLGLTDGPVDDAENVVIRFTGVEVKPADGPALNFDFTTPKDLDLLSLQGGNAAPLITAQQVPAGNYEWLRLKVSAVQDNVFDSYIQINGTMHELDVPSGSQTGLKLISGFTVAQGGDANYTIDFDLRKSVTAPPGQAPAYILKPVLRLVNNLEVGTLAGTVDPSIIAAECSGDGTGAVYLWRGADVTPDDVDGDAGDPLSTGLVSLVAPGSYQYQIGFLAAGSYTIAYTCDAATDIADSDEALTFVGTQNITITAGMTSTGNFDGGM